LGGKTGNANHGKAAVVDLLSLEHVKCLIGLGSDVSGVPAKVSGAGLGLDRGAKNLNGRDGKADLIA
jgi:hypothetical protein